MGLLDILQQVVSASGALNANADQHFDSVAKSAPQDIFAHGMNEAMRSDQTPPIGDLLGKMFGQAQPGQQADMLNQILSSVGPGVLASIAGGAGGGILGSLLRPSAAGAVPTITPEQASQLSPDQVSQIATRAEQHSPGALDALSGFYAQHPALVKTLGSAVMAIAMAKMHERMTNRS